MRNFCCCFNANICCGWYKPRPILMKLIVLLSLYECASWLIFGVMCILTPSDSIATDLYWFFSFFVPFIKNDKCIQGPPVCIVNEEIHERNIKIMKNFFIISIPQIAQTFYKTYKGLVAWEKRFEIKATERFYRI